MREIIIFKEILNDLKERPREVTLFGERGLIFTEKKGYDLYYYFAEGTNHSLISLPERYIPLPVFLWSGTEKELIEKISGYSKSSRNYLAGVCGKDIFCLYPVERSKAGIIVHPSIDHLSSKKKSLSEKVSKNEDWEDFPEELERKISELKNCLGN